MNSRRQFALIVPVNRTVTTPYLIAHLSSPFSLRPHALKASRLQEFLAQTPSAPTSCNANSGQLRPPSSPSFHKLHQQTHTHLPVALAWPRVPNSLGNDQVR